MTFQPSKNYSPNFHPFVSAKIYKRQQEVIAQIKALFDPKILETYCSASEDDFAANCEVRLGKASKYRGARPHYFFDNNAQVLAVAHLDSVCRPDTFKVTKQRVYSPVLDDRLGAYVICDLLPRLGLNFDILLTTDEEKGQSTARDFVTTKEYNWAFEFDRAGDDTVMYQFETDQLIGALEEHGHFIGDGIFTDICDLDHLGCGAFNVGVGYHDYHSKNAYVVLDELFKQIARFVTFYEDFSETLIAYEPKNAYCGGRYAADYEAPYPLFNSDEAWQEYYAELDKIEADILERADRDDKGESSDWNDRFKDVVNLAESEPYIVRDFDPDPLTWGVKASRRAFREDVTNEEINAYFEGFKEL